MSESIIITNQETGLRLDVVLTKHFPDCSRTYFQKLIDQGLVLINGDQVKKGAKLAEGDELEVEFPLALQPSLQPEPIPLDIVYEDEWLLAINKPPGLVVHPGAGNWSGTFVNALLHHCPFLPGREGGVRPGIVHRLDKETSGLLLAAKNQQAHRRLVTLFAERQIQKEYLAICCGKLSTSSVQEPIGRDPLNRKKQAVCATGKAAHTDLQTLATAQDLSIIRALPLTGRTHQIRVHLRHIGSPILGDRLYGWPHWNSRYRVERHLLHAYRLSFAHPITHKMLQLEAPPPADLRRFLISMTGRESW